MSAARSCRLTGSGHGDPAKGKGAKSMAISMKDTRVSVYATSPEKIKSVLLQDGWHDVSNCELIQFAVAEASSPPAPNKVYPSLRFRDSRGGKTAITPLRQVLAFET